MAAILQHVHTEQRAAESATADGFASSVPHDYFSCL